jgi:hypothetical protein
MKKVLLALLTLWLIIGWASASSAAGLTLIIRDGRVSLDAQDVTIRQILTEWARVGKTQIVNLERVNSGAVTLKFDGLPESEALDIVLRALPGYLAAPRRSRVADASVFDRIVLLTSTSVAPAAAVNNQFRPPPPTTFQDPAVVANQLRLMSGNVNPGMAPDADDRAPNDPTVLAPPPPGVASPFSPLQPPVRTFTGPPGVTPAPAAQAPSNPWNAPVGTRTPSLPTPPPAPTTNNPQNRPAAGTRPPQADQ